MQNRNTNNQTQIKPINTTCRVKYTKINSINQHANIVPLFLILVIGRRRAARTRSASSEWYPSSESTVGVGRERLPMLALFLKDPSVNLTPNSLRPPPLPLPLFVEQVRMVWPLLLQCEQRRVIVSKLRELFGVALYYICVWI